jgi:ABC-type iron transport system FetAB permease component
LTGSYATVILVFAFQVNILAILGGKTTKDAVKRMLGRAFRRSLALQINWTGAAGKIAFKSLNLKSVLHSK